MRFRYAHKLSTYVMAVCAYCALVFSGELSDGIVLLGFLAMLGSWFMEPPRIDHDKLTVPWAILSLFVLAYTVMTALSGGDFLLIGGEFLIYLLIAKLCNRRTCKDYLHAYLLSFLMLVAGTVLNTEFSYGVFFLGYVVSTTWAAILFHLRREMEDNYLLKHADDMSYKRVQVERIMNSRRIVGRRFFFGTGLVSITIFAASALLFLAIPRIGYGLFWKNGRGGITMTGFSDGVTLGGHGLIKDDKTVVMRVQVDNEYQGRRAPYVHWRGVAFETYENGEWKRKRKAPRTRRQVLYPNDTLSHHHLLYAEAVESTDELERRLEGGMRQEIYLEPFSHDVLFGASMPLAYEFEIPRALRGRNFPRTERNDEMRYTHSSGIKYVVYSRLSTPDPDDLRAAPKVLPEEYKVYLQLPPEITPEVKELARRITRHATNDYDKAVAIQTWLKENLSYTLHMRSPGKTEPIHFFLFEWKKGHCEYFSSAMAIMLRAVGVPTRNVNGFLGGEWNEYDDYIAVRAGDAHSWLEVYFHEYGWVTFDPTPSAEVDRLGRGGGGIRERMRRFFDTLRFQWFKWVIDYDLDRQFSIFRRIRASLSGSTEVMKNGLSSVKNWLKRHETPAVLVGVIALALALLARLRWRTRRPDTRAEGERRRRDVVSQLYRQALARLAKRGYRKKLSDTPREFARQLQAQEVPGASALHELTELHYQVAYGSVPADTALAHARALSVAMEQAFVEARRAHRSKLGRTPALATGSEAGLEPGDATNET